MDDQYRATLKLISDFADRLEVSNAGYQLILIARDFVEDGNLIEARDHLARIKPEYFRDYIHKHVEMNEDFAQAVALLIDTFGLQLEWKTSGLIS